MMIVYGKSKIYFCLVSEWYINQSEPIPQVGVKMGLSVILDGHSDVIEPYTVDSDFRSFQVVISSPGDFPLTFKKGFKIQSGYRNMVALSAIRVDDYDTLRSLTPKDRHCYYEDETTSLVKFHKNYSQANCILECTLSNAKMKLNVTNKSNKTW